MTANPTIMHKLFIDGALVMLSMSSTMPLKYQVQRKKGIDFVLGSGAYGVVYGGMDGIGALVAIKKLNRELFREALDCVRIYREIKILRALGSHENIISLKDIECSVDSGRLMEINLVFDRYDTDLGYVIRSKNILSKEHVEYILFQIFRGVFYIHSANIVHRDLKPANILINSDCSLVICDFGIARPVPDAIKTSNPASTVSTDSSDLSQYVVTRWYRSPELINNCQENAQPSDVWSVGCIFAELLLRTPIFNGINSMHVLELINRLLSRDMVYLADYQRRLRENFKYQFKKTVATEEAIDLVIKLLEYNPNERITARGALGHSFFNKFLGHIETPEFSSSLDENFIEFETKTNRTTEEVHRYILDEIGLASPIVTQSIFSSVNQVAQATEKPKEGFVYADPH